MPMRLIQLILGKLGWHGDARPTVTMLPPGSARTPSAADALCRITDNYVIPPYGEYGQMYDGVEGQDILIEIAADGGILVHLFEGDEDDGTELFEADAPPFHSPCRISYQLPATGLHGIGRKPRRRVHSSSPDRNVPGQRPGDSEEGAVTSLRRLPSNEHLRQTSILGLVGIWTWAIQT